MRLLAVVAALLLSACASAPRSREPSPTPSTATEHPLTILVSIDGFRADYLDRGVTPTLSAIAAEGLRVRALQPSYPTLTFPNHYTLVTGLHPDHHGVVNNRMLDPAIPGAFRLSDRAQVMDRRWWDDAEPIWVTAEKAGLRTATMFWPGSEAPIGGVRPSEWVPFQESITAEDRVGVVLAWLTMPGAERPHLVTLYLDDVDTAGHDHGPNSAELNAALGRVDAAIKTLRDGLAERGTSVNLIVASDHGMAEIAPERTVFLDDLIDLERVGWMQADALAGLTAADDGYDAALAATLLRPHAHMTCWRKAEIPARLVYGRHRRVPPYVCAAAPGWRITTREARSRARRVSLGAHGYDPALPEMQAFLVAAGPAFRSGATLERARSIDVYPLLARLLGLRPRPHDGTISAFESALTE